MDLRDLRVFVAVVEEGGILKASRKLHRVPSSISTRIKQLEASMNSRLFHRHKQRLHLSPSGELLLPYAVKLLRLADEATCALDGTVPSGMLRLGALESTTASRLPNFKSLAAARTSWPGWPLRRKLMLRFVVTARPTGPIADSSTTYMAKSASAISVVPETVPPGRSIWSL